jgi:tricorn protease
MWQELHTTDSHLSPGESIDWLNSMISWLSPSRWFTVLVTASAAAAPEGATVMNGITAPAVSPDGKRMVFEWIDDLWTSSTEGGEAVRLVDNPARDAFPQWTPDGSRIVFSSDRSGSLQVYSIPASGGETLQHTDHSQGNELECLSPDGSHALVRGLREVSGPRATVLLTINLQNEEREQRVFTAPVGDGAAWSPDGNQVLFCKGGEALHRKGYRGSRASQIWRFDLTTESFTQLTTAETESRAPLWHSDGQGFYFLSAETGTLNLWTKRFTEPTAKALTHFSGDGIFMGQPAADGSVFVLQRGSQLLRFQPALDSQPRPLELWTKAPLAEVSPISKKITSTVDSDFTADGNHAIFAAEGELWTIRGPGGQTERLTETPAAESNVICSVTSDWLFFLRNDGIHTEIVRAKLGENALQEVTTLVAGPRSKCRLKLSPDGQRLAWVEGTGDLFTANIDGSDLQKVYPCWNLPSFDWSPDGQWLAVAAEDRNANRDIWLVAATGGSAPVNLTLNPATEGSPHWSPDGQKLAFSAKRNGSNKQELWWMDFGKDGLKREMPSSAFRQFGDKAKRLSTGDREPTSVIWAADSKALWFQAQKEADKAVYSVALKTNEIQTVIQERGMPIRMTAGGALLWRINRVPAILKGGALERFPISANLKRDRAETQQLAFRQVWRTLGERFYDSTMNGTDWQALREKYEPTAREARTSRQFERVVHQLCGELNASHLSFVRQPWEGEPKATTKKEEVTAFPGILFRNGTGDSPLEIAQVLADSPVSLVENAPQAGEFVVKIGDTAVTQRTPLQRLFNGAEGNPLRITVRSKEGVEREMDLRCISYTRARTLDLAQRESLARQRVESAGKFAYLRMPDMFEGSLRAVELAVYRESLETEGMILDLRNNGGGREADRLLALFCQPVHSFTIPRDGPQGYPITRRVNASWDKPLVILSNEFTASNAEIFCHATLHTGRAPVVGTATAGGVISAVKEKIPHAGELQIPFRGWFHVATGANLDLRGAQPSVPIDLLPADQQQGRDPQLEKAVEILQELCREAP